MTKIASRGGSCLKILQLGRWYVNSVVHRNAAWDIFPSLNVFDNFCTLCRVQSQMCLDSLTKKLQENVNLRIKKCCLFCARAFFRKCVSPNSSGGKGWATSQRIVQTFLGNQSSCTPFRPFTTSGSVFPQVVLLFSTTFFLTLFVPAHFIPPSTSHFLDFMLRSRILPLALYGTNIAHSTDPTLSRFNMCNRQAINCTFRMNLQ